MNTVPTRVALLGWPVAHSRSPAMHNAAFRALGMAWEYLALPVPPGRLAEAVAGLREVGVAGANVTVPHKVAVMALLDEVTTEAAGIGAVNTIVNDGGRLVGYNTDGVGLLRALREGDAEPRGSRVLLLGAGGAARAALYGLLAVGAEVTIANRDAARARALAEQMGERFGARVGVVPLDGGPALRRALAGSTLLLNATSVGMAPNADASPLPEGLPFAPTLTVFDLVYSPAETRLLATARAAGCRAIDGLGMLLHQGAAAFELWTGRPAPLDAMRRALAEE